MSRRVVRRVALVGAYVLIGTMLATAPVVASHCSGCITNADLATDAVSKSKIRPDAVGSSEILAEAVTNSELGTEAVTPGKVKNYSLGTGDMAFAAGRPQYGTTAIDTNGNVGASSSITIGVDGLGLMSYFDSTNQNLKIAHCRNVACTSFTKATPDSAGNVGVWSSITIGEDGFGRITYYDSSNGRLKLARCLNVACSSSVTRVLDDPAGSVGSYTSVTTDMRGDLMVSYYDITNGNLKFGRCQLNDCSDFSAVTVDSAGIVGTYTSIMADDSIAGISYYDGTNGNLKFARCTNIACSTRVISVVDSTGMVGLFTSVVMGTDNRPIISYFDNTNHDLKVAHCTGVDCATSTKAVVHSQADAGRWSSITVGSDGMPVVASKYTPFSGTSWLSILHCGSEVCSSGTPNSPEDSSAMVRGAYAAITIGSDGFPLITYYDEVNDDLRVMHCASVYCTGFHRRR